MPIPALNWLDKIIDGDFYISVINKIELLGFDDIQEIEEQKILEFIDAAQLILLNDMIVEKR